MSDTKMSLRNGIRLKASTAGAVLLWGCADLALEADRVPAELDISPGRVLLDNGESVQLNLVVKDQNGDVMKVPGWAPPTWRVSDEAVAKLGDDAMLTGTAPGRVIVTARVADLTADACFHVDSDPVNLTAQVVYATQAAQNRDGALRLVAGRPAFLRVFIVADEARLLEPEVQVTLLQEDSVVFEKRLGPATNEVPTDVDESDLNGSYNLELPGPLIQSGARLVVELDPDCAIPLAPGSRVRYPKSLDVVEPPLYRLILVPTIFRAVPDSSVFDWTDGATPDSEHMRLGRTILPVGAIEVEGHEGYTTNLDLRNFGNWSRWLSEIGVLYEQEGRRGYHYGVVASSATFSRAGIANIGYPVSVGVDVDFVQTHEVGHTMNLYHAPCGGAGGPDRNYPYDGGSIGVWGYDIAGGRLLDPELYRDVMSYCFENIWISDYQFDRALTHRLDGDGGVDHGAGLGASRDPHRDEVLVVWGGVRDGRLELDPSFVLEGPVVLPAADGPYRVEGIGAGGATRFSLSFSPTPLEHGGANFVFFVPYQPEWAAMLDRMVLTGPEGEYALTRDGEPPMAVVTDRSTGRVRAILRDWDGGPLPGGENARVTVTTGIPAGGVR